MAASPHRCGACTISASLPTDEERAKFTSLLSGPTTTTALAPALREAFPGVAGLSTSNMRTIRRGEYTCCVARMAAHPEPQETP